MIVRTLVCLALIFTLVAIAGAVLGRRRGRR
jgi:hypothetical protein